MHLTIEGTPRDLTDLRTFRKQFDLPDSFRIALFEPKDYTGLGSIEQGGGLLNGVRLHLLDAVPDVIVPLALVAQVTEWSALFRRELEAVNEPIGLREAEIDFAVSGFEDVLQKWAYGLILAHTTHSPLPEFETIYEAWLDDSVRVSSREHVYMHQDVAWKVQIINHAYGRVGMIVSTGEAVHYLRDESLACPAAGFMFTLLRDMAGEMLRGLGK